MSGKRRQKPKWLYRLLGEIYLSPRSLRETSNLAGFGVNYLSQLSSENFKEPSFSRVVVLCDVLDVSITYIVTGAEMTHIFEELARHLAPLPREQQESFLALLRTLSPSPSPSEEQIPVASPEAEQKP